MQFKKVIGRKILNSRGNPAVEVDVILVKLKQIGVLTEALETVALAREHG
jgi:enolase